MTSQNIVEQWLRENSITEVECLVPDMTAMRAANLSLPKSS